MEPNLYRKTMSQVIIRSTSSNSLVRSQWIVSAKYLPQGHEEVVGSTTIVSANYLPQGHEEVLGSTTIICNV